jgi:2-oxo-3-hexenedioate decarboxylase
VLEGAVGATNRCSVSRFPAPPPLPGCAFDASGSRVRSDGPTAHPSGAGGACREGLTTSGSVNPLLYGYYAPMTPADDVLDAVDRHHLIAPLSDREPALDEDGAYAIAWEIHRRRRGRGERPIGRKIGFTNRTIWAEYGVWAPIWSHVYDSTVHHAADGHARLAISHLLQPRIEPEIQLRFERTPPVTRDEAAILESIDWIAHGFEIVQSVYPEWRFTKVDAIAAFGLHGALVVGRPIAVRDIDDCAAKLRAFTIALSRDDGQTVRGGGTNVLDTPLLAFAHLAEMLREQARFAPVQAGEIVTTGTLTQARPVSIGETWSTALDGIDLPGLSITFT